MLLVVAGGGLFVTHSLVMPGRADAAALTTGAAGPALSAPATSSPATAAPLSGTGTSTPAKASEPADVLTLECKALNDELRTRCKSKGAAAEACFKNDEVMPLETYSAYKDGKSTDFSPQSGLRKCTKKQELKECAKCEKGAALFPKTEGLGEVTKGYTICKETKDAVWICREKKQGEAKDACGSGSSASGASDCKATKDDTGARTGGTKGSSSTTGSSSRSGSSSIVGSSSTGGQSALNTKAAQGFGQGLGYALGKALTGQNQQTQSTGGGNEKPWWWDQLYGQNTPTEAPKCTDGSLSAAPATVMKGETSTISWDVSGKGTIKSVVTYVTTDEKGAIQKGSLGVVDGGSVDVSPERSTTYTIKVANEIGTTVCTPAVKVLVRPADEKDTTEATASPSRIDLQCEPSSIKSGESSNVMWSCPAKTEKSIGSSTEDSEFGTDGAAEGTMEVQPRRDATYVVRCRDRFDAEIGRGSCRIAVLATSGSAAPGTNSRPRVHLSADPPVAPKGGSVKVSWRSDNTASCVIYGPGCDTYGRDSEKCYKEVGRSGYVTGNLYETSQFRAECIAPDRRTRASDAITVDLLKE